MAQRNNFIVCKASAGSGKTFKLVNEYLCICFRDDSGFKFSKILAITFTNKAAGEMKERIIDHLRKLSSPVNSKLYDDQLMRHYIHITGLPEEKIQSKALNIRENILHNYSSFAISTIDKFTHKLIRSFARDLHLSADFDIETDIKKPIAKSIDELLSLVGIEKEITSVLEKYVDHLSDESAAWQPDKKLREFGEQLLNDDSLEHIEASKKLAYEEFLTLNDSLSQKIKALQDELLKIGDDFYALCRVNEITDEHFHGKAKGLQRHFKHIKSLKLQNTSFYFTDNDFKIFNEGKIFHKSLFASVPEPVQEKITGFINDLIEFQDSKIKMLSFYKILQQNIFNLSLIKRIADTLREINNSDNVILINEFNRLISNVVKNDPAPFIYERIGEKYKHILIDEFQDTSVLQFTNLLPLIENSLSGGYQCLLVGDPKQAIYRWRGGDIDQFIRLPELNDAISNEIKQSIKTNYAAQELDTNYRSGKNIVEFNNAFFKKASEKLNDPYKNIYADLHQHAKLEGGYVELNLFNPKEDADTDQSILKTSLDRINECLNDGFTYADIAIITRTNSNGLLIAQHLHEAGIPVISRDSLLLSSSAQVQLIMNLIRHIAYPQDAVAGFKVIQLHEQLKNKSELPVYEKYKLKKGVFNVYAYLKDSGYNVSRNYWLSCTAYQLILELNELFFKDTSSVYLRFLSENIFNKWKNNPLNIVELCEWWKENQEKLSIKSSENANAVQIMSIHSSKGLQFPVVIIPFATWKPKHGLDWIWIDTSQKNLPIESTLVRSNASLLDRSDFSEKKENEKNKSTLDDLNLLYVAFTRPEERLYIISIDEAVLHNYVTELTEILEESEHGKWITGDKTNYSAKEKSYQQTTPVDYKHEFQWMNQMHLSISKAESREIQEQEYIAKTTGILLHRLFEKSKTKEEAIIQLEAELKRNGILVKLRDQLLQEIMAVFDHQELGKLMMDEAALNEISIIDQEGRAYRPDKVIVRDNEVIIVDFKTGLPKDDHVIQLSEYGKLFEEMNYPNIKKYLFYTRKNELKSV